MKVAVFGASGFLGTRIVERLLERNDVEVRPFIRRLGNAWRLMRAGVPMSTADVTSAAEVNKAIAGCTHVVNCTRGSHEAMIGGLKNLLSASKALGIKRFVHISSVSVYGDPPPPEAEREAAPARPTDGYGREKLEQDDLVARSAQSGLDCVVLCPPNISGIYSPFLNSVLDDMRAGRLALVDGGQRPINIVDVDNLTHAVLLALQIPKGDGRRIFVMDGVGLTWKDLTDALAPLAELSAPLSVIPASGVPSAPRVVESSSLWRSIKHLVSSDVREVLRRDPLLARFDARVRKLAAMGGKGMEDRLRYSIEGPTKVARVPDRNPYSSRYNTTQLRGVCHRIDRAQEVLGYRPVLSFGESMTRFGLWYQTMYGLGEDYWPLARTLYRLQV
jgi:nucleoside-diphosphate-sugar epimerase